MAEHTEALDEVQDNSSHSRLYYSIGEVCKITGVEPYVLRYWETEFSQLRPKKSRGGNRAYREKDIEIVKYIKHLLYEEEYTISGARKKLSQKLYEKEDNKNSSPSFSDELSYIKKELKEILRLIKE